MKPLGGTQAFANEPKAVVARRSKYREPPPEEEVFSQSRNIHNDHRVFRGNTYANLKEQFKENTPSENVKFSARRRKEIPSLFDCPLPKPLREPVDLSRHLEEQDAHIPVCVDIDAQTGDFAPMEPERPYIPQKRGVDIATMVEDGDLLVGFDELVTPLIDTLVYKTIDQALIEVNEEEQHARFTEFRKDWQVRRQEEHKEWQKDAAKEVARHEATQAKMEKLRVQKKFEAQIRRKMEASALSRAYLRDLIPSTLERFRKLDLFADADHDAATQFFSYVAGLAVSRRPRDDPLPRLVDEMVTKVVQDTQERRRRGRADLQARIEQARKEAEERRIAALTKTITIRVAGESVRLAPEAEETTEASPEDGDAEAAPEEGPLELTLTFRLDDDFEAIKEKMAQMLKERELTTDFSLGVDFISEETILENPEALANASSVSVQPTPPPPAPEEEGEDA